MKVKAIKEGFYGGKLRRVGASFDVVKLVEIVDGKEVTISSVEDQFSKVWMKAVAAEKKSK